MTYMLISVFEREIVTQQFDTFEEAQKEMMMELKEEFDKYDDTPWDEVKNKEECDDYEDFGFGVDWAWSNIDDDCNCDWKIVEIN